MNFKFLTSSLLCLFLFNPAYAGDIVSEAPADPDAASKYVFYLHGSVEEADGETEKYTAAVEAIAEGDATVITEVRGDTDPNSYATKIKSQVAHLLGKGVPAKNIYVSGFSKGAVITLAAAGTINNSNINYILLAGCSEFLNEKYSVDPAKAVGRIFVIYDSEDEKYGSCDGTLTESDKLKLEETELDSGKGHKVFRVPKEKFISQWRDPMLEWIDN